MDYSQRIKQAVNLIKEATRISAFTGAGVSTESGISDFRSPGGVWNRYRIVSYRELLSSHDARVEYWSMKKELFFEMKNAKPSKAHMALAELEKTGKLDCLITQNIDGLHQDAGSTSVIELHGTNRKAICVTCGQSWPIEEIQVILESGNLDPCCEICNGFIKPATISFGQPMPEKKVLDAYECASRSDLFLMAGSSLQVEPAASIPREAYRAMAKLIFVNHTETPHNRLASIVFRENAGEVMGEIVKGLQG